MVLLFTWMCGGAGERGHRDLGDTPPVPAPTPPLPPPTSVTLTQSCGPMREAVLTVSPNRQYRAW